MVRVLIPFLASVVAACQSTHTESRAARLRYAFERGDVSSMRSILISGASPETTDQHGWPLLLTAAYDGQAAAVEVLLSAGANPNIERARMTPLGMGYPYPQVVASLLCAGADPNHMSDGVSPLMSAASGGFIESVSLLVTAGSNVDATNRAGATAVELAERAGHTNIASFLRSHVRATAEASGANRHRPND
jgi:hypothetical protein